MLFQDIEKSLLKLGTEFQSRTYDAMVSHTAIVFTRYILLEWIRRKENDQKTYGELFFLFCEYIQDMDFGNALPEPYGSVWGAHFNAIGRYHSLHKK